MGQNKLSAFDLFKEYHDKDKFFGKLTAAENVLGNLLSHYVLLVLLSGVYGIVMGSYNGFKQAISSGVKVPVFFTLTFLASLPALGLVLYLAAPIRALDRPGADVGAAA